jgi:hypothetical protein
VMQFAGMNRAKCLQCGGAKCITYSCVCPYPAVQISSASSLPHHRKKLRNA